MIHSSHKPICLLHKSHSIFLCRIYTAFLKNPGCTFKTHSLSVYVSIILIVYVLNNGLMLQGWKQVKNHLTSPILSFSLYLSFPTFLTIFFCFSINILVYSYHRNAGSAAGLLFLVQSLNQSEADPIDFSLNDFSFGTHSPDPLLIEGLMDDLSNMHVHGRLCVTYLYYVRRMRK